MFFCSVYRLDLIDVSFIETASNCFSSFSVSYRMVLYRFYVSFVDFIDIVSILFAFFFNVVRVGLIFLGSISYRTDFISLYRYHIDIDDRTYDIRDYVSVTLDPRVQHFVPFRNSILTVPWQFQNRGRCRSRDGALF